MKQKLPKTAKITTHQWECIISAHDDMCAMIGGADAESDKEFKKIVNGINRFLKKNGVKRNYS